MYSPNIISKESFQLAWIDALKHLERKNWRLRNLIIQVTNPSAFNDVIHQKVVNFARSNNILTPKHVAYTIFPHNIYRAKKSANELFVAYNRRGGFYERIKRRSRKIRWGTYFKRMTHYKTNSKIINQLKEIIEAINTRERISKATYTIIIQNLGKETIQPRGAPCLNFLIVQLEPKPKKTLGILCIYRNQDYLERAYGNFLGLCNLLNFLANETNSVPGPLTCVVSHAYVNGKKQNLVNLIKELN